jgi:ABC-type transport system involved in cytochrome c biogenesis permease subunit
MAHDVNGIMVLIHPPLAILGYLVTLIALKSAIQFWRAKGSGSGIKDRRKDLGIALGLAWWLTFLGLVTGMIWAYFAWGSFWSWDPKETGTLVVFLTLTGAYLLHLFERRAILILGALVINILAIVYTIWLSFAPISIHSYG